MDGPFRFCLGPLEIQMVGGPDPQQKMSTESPEICLFLNSYFYIKLILNEAKPHNRDLKGY